MSFDPFGFDPFGRTVVVGAGSPVASSIVALWDFESAGRGADSAGANTLTITGTPTYAAGKIGDAAGGFSVSDYFHRVGSVGPIGTNARTYAGWFKTTSTSTAFAVMVSAGASTAAGTLFWVTIENGTLWVRTHAGRVASYAGGLNDGLWHSFVASMPSGANLADVVVYVDGAASAGTVSNNGPLNTASADFGVGARPASVGTPDPFTGWLDQIIVADRAWDSTDASYHYNSGAGRATSEILTA